MLILLPPSEKKAAEPGPAITVYTGVLYQGLGWATLTKTAQARAQKSIAIISAKYGSLKCLDPIEPYKEKIDAAHMRNPKLFSDLMTLTRTAVFPDEGGPDMVRVKGKLDLVPEASNRGEFDPRQAARMKQKSRERLHPSGFKPHES